MSDQTLREALDKRLGALPVMQHTNGYPVQALPKAELLDLLAAHPAEPALVASRERVAEVLRAELLRQRADEWFDVFGLARYLLDSLLAAGVLRDEAEVKAEGAKRAIDEIDSWMSTADDGLYDEWVSKRGAVRAANGVAS